jgi:hypothetical protein
LPHHNLCFELIEVHCENSKLMLIHLNLLLFKWTFSVCWKFGKFIWKSQCFFQCWFWMLFYSAKIESQKSNYWSIEVYNTFKISTVGTASYFNSPVLFIPAHSLIHEFDYSWTQIKWICWGTRQLYTVLTYRRVVFFSCFFYSCVNHIVI